MPGAPAARTSTAASEHRPRSQADRSSARAARPLAVLDGARRRAACARPPRPTSRRRSSSKPRAATRRRWRCSRIRQPRSRGRWRPTSSTTRAWRSCGSDAPPTRARRSRRFRPTTLTGFLVEAAALREAESDEALGDYAAAVAVYERLAAMKTTAPDEVLTSLAKAAKASGDDEKADGGARAPVLRVPVQRSGRWRPPRNSATNRSCRATRAVRRELARAERLFAAKQYTPARGRVRAPPHGGAGRRSRSRPPPPRRDATTT